MSLDRAEVEKIAHLARLALDEDQAAGLAAEKRSETEARLRRYRHGVAHMRPADTRPSPRRARRESAQAQSGSAQQ